MRVLFVNGSMGRGGAERVISILAQRLPEYHYYTDICLLLSNKVDYDLPQTTRVFDFSGANNQANWKNVPKWIRSIRQYIKKEKPDIVISMSLKEYCLTFIAALGQKTKIMVSERNDPRHDGRGRIADIVTNLLYPKAKKVIFQTKRAQSYFNQKIQNNSVIIPNPVKIVMEASPSSEKRIVSVGRLEPQKNHEMLVEAFAEFRKDYPDYTLTIYGEGSLRPVLQEKAKELKIEESVYLPGEEKDIHKKISNAGMFVLSSDYEGLSNALLEALMMGLPCITTDCAGSEECITDHVSGLIIPVGDTCAMVDAMLLYANDEELRSYCAKNGKKSAERFSESVVVKQWKDAFDDVLKK